MITLRNDVRQSSVQTEAEKIEAISSRLQQGFSDCTINPLVPKAFQVPVRSQALTEAIQALTLLAQAPLERRLQAQQDEIAALHETVARLQTLLAQRSLVA